MTETRLSPDLLLAEARSEHLGKLKIFLGAAPGVGKTFAMLGAAKARQAEGVDIVIGVVETHKRHDTEALAQGLASVPLQTIDYRGLEFAEMDLDALLKRKPKLALVDELAHTNVPGARHPKRYMDVQELLEAGIDVYATLNVQHIESLNDIVVRITGVTVRETVPDTVMQLAHAIELIDLPPDELLQRLKDGKVYIPEQARLAVNRFFTPGNLTALRELALRQAAERVDDQMASYMRRHAIEGPWPTSNRVMVCISDDRQASSLVRAAKRSAERKQVPWLVLYIETGRHSRLSARARNDVAEAMRMAEAMHGETLTIASEDCASEILRVARERNVSTIIIGKSARSFWSRLTRPSVAAAVLQRGDEFDVLLVSNHDARRASGRDGGRRHDDRRSGVDPGSPSIDGDALAETTGIASRLRLRSFGRSLAIIAIASLVAWPMSRYASGATLAFLYLIAVFLIVVDLGLENGLLGTLLGSVALGLLVTRPPGGFWPQHQSDLFALLGFTVTGVTVSLIGDALHRRIATTRRNAERAQSLYAFVKSVAAAGGSDDIAQAIVRHVATTLSARVAVLRPRPDRLEVVASVPPDLRLDTASNAAMDWAWRHGRPAGFRSDTLPGAPFYGLPLQTGTAADGDDGGRLGVLAVHVGHGHALTSDQRHFLTNVAYQAATALERARLVADVAQARLQTETEKLRASLLSSVSHDLRTPLDRLLTVTRELERGWDQLGDDDRRDRIATAVREAGQLGRYIDNMIDMTMLVTGNVKLDRKPLDLRAIINHAIDRMHDQIGQRPLKPSFPETLPMILGDERALGRVFTNLIENACRHTEPATTIGIAAMREQAGLVVTISDNGPGIPEHERERVFDMFYRIKGGAPSGSGAGLGLSICRGLIEAHQGKISAQAGPGDKGLNIIVRLPFGPQ